MDPKSVRDVVPYFDANLLGIDIFELEKERFSSREHKKLMVQHQRRVQHFEHQKHIAEFYKFVGAVGEIWDAREKERRDKIRATKRAKRYAFSDKQMEIAMRSLDAKDPM